MVTSSMARSTDTESWGTTNMSIQPGKYGRSLVKVPCGIITSGRSPAPNRRGGGGYTPATAYGPPPDLIRRVRGGALPDKIAGNRGFPGPRPGLAGARRGWHQRPRGHV